MEDRAVSSEYARHLSSQTREWLVSIGEGLKRYSGASASIKYPLQILVGLWICERAFLDDREFATTRSHMQKVCQYLAANADSAADLLQADPSLVLLASGILRFFNVQNTPLEQFARQISQLLQAHADQDEEEANELFMIRFLLQQLQLHEPLHTYPLREMCARDLIQADDLAVGRLAINIAAATDYGQRELSMDHTYLQELHALLPILALDHMRRYNFESGMQLLRCMRYLNMCQSRSFHACCNFLCQQQQPDGRFGFLAQEVAQLHISGSEANLKVYLPYSVSFLWTLAEVVNPQFILVKSF